MQHVYTHQYLLQTITATSPAGHRHSAAPVTVSSRPVVDLGYWSTTGISLVDDWSTLVYTLQVVGTDAAMFRDPPDS